MATSSFHGYYVKLTLHLAVIDNMNHMRLACGENPNDHFKTLKYDSLIEAKVAKEPVCDKCWKAVPINLREGTELGIL